MTQVDDGWIPIDIHYTAIDICNILYILYYRCLSKRKQNQN